MTVTQARARQGDTSIGAEGCNGVGCLRPAQLVKDETAGLPSQPVTANPRSLT